MIPSSEEIDTYWIRTFRKKIRTSEEKKCIWIRLQGYRIRIQHSKIRGDILARAMVLITDVNQEHNARV